MAQQSPQASQSFVGRVLVLLNAPVNSTTVTALQKWSAAEGVNPAYHNPYGIKPKDPRTGRRTLAHYASDEAGAQATAKVLKQKNMSGIAAALRKGANLAEIWQAINTSPWCYNAQGPGGRCGQAGNYPNPLYASLANPPALERLPSTTPADPGAAPPAAMPGAGQTLPGGTLAGGLFGGVQDFFGFTLPQWVKIAAGGTLMVFGGAVVVVLVTRGEGAAGRVVRRGTRGLVGGASGRGRRYAAGVKGRAAEQGFDRRMEQATAGGRGRKGHAPGNIIDAEEV